MIIEKNIIVSIDIPDPITFAANVEVNLLSRTREIFEGRCYDQCLILNVIELVRYSEIICGLPANPAQGSINVEFRANAIVYMNNELLLAKIIAVNKSGHLMAAVDHGNCIITAEKKFESLTPGQFIIVAVNYVLYEVDTEVIAINASLFLPTRNIYPLYKFDPTGLDKPAAEKLLSRLEIGIADKYAENTKGWDTFRKLCYAYSTPPKITRMPIRQLIDATESLWISRDIRMDKFEQEVIVESADRAEFLAMFPNSPVLDSLDPNTVLERIVADWISYVNMLSALLATYSDREIVAKNKNVFAIYSAKI